jgi:hypothetical protein|tara:strand:- start:446 stop:766 length:321 start_codon:yes stop_codon:yes gene_type:complete
MEKNIIDFAAIKEDHLNERVGSYAGLGFHIKNILSSMFRKTSYPVTFRGSQAEVLAFMEAIGKEKSFMEAYSLYGLDDPRTFKNKSKLDNAVNKFERKTGIKWPFK